MRCRRRTQSLFPLLCSLRPSILLLLSLLLGCYRGLPLVRIGNCRFGRVSCSRFKLLVVVCARGPNTSDPDRLRPPQSSVLVLYRPSSLCRVGNRCLARVSFHRFRIFHPLLFTALSFPLILGLLISLRPSPFLESISVSTVSVTSVSWPVSTL